MVWRRELQFHALAYLTARHWVLSRVVFTCVGYFLTILLTARPVLAQQTARRFWTDDYKTAMHQLDWFVCYGWLGHVFTRRPAFDIAQGMPVAGLDALDLMLAGRTTPVELRAQLYIASARANQAGSVARRDQHLERYRQIADQIARQISAPLRDPVKHAPAFTQHQARTTLQAAGQLMQRVGLQWYIVSGTFLGAVRGGNFLAHDYDIDIGVHAEDFDHSAFLAGLRADPQFCLVRIDDYVDLTDPDLRPVQARALYKITHRSGVEVDIFLHHLEGGQRWHGSARHRWWNDDFDISSYSLAGLTVPGPSNADKYLRENYGEWQIPQTDFNCSTGTPNVSFNRNLVSIAQFLIQAQTGSETAQSVLAAEGYLQDGRFRFPWA